MEVTLIYFLEIILALLPAQLRDIILAPTLVQPATLHATHAQEEPTTNVKAVLEATIFILEIVLVWLHALMDIMDQQTNALIVNRLVLPAMEEQTQTACLAMELSFIILQTTPA